MDFEQVNKTFPKKDEGDRLKCLESYDVADSTSIKEFDDLVHLVSITLEVPIVVFSIIDKDKQWIKASVGCEMKMVEKEELFSNQFITNSDFLEIVGPCNPTIQPLGSQRDYNFCAGVPVLNKEGFTIGSLLVIDFIPRALTKSQRVILETIGKQFTANLELRKCNLNPNERKSQKLDASLDIVIESIPFPLFIKNRRQEFVLVNDAFCQLNKVERKEVLGKTMDELTHDLITRTFWENEERIFTQGAKIESDEITIPYGDNTTITVTAQFSTFTDILGHSYLLGCLMDVTERREIERALIQEQYLVQSLMNYIPDSIYFKDLDSRFLRTSRSMLSRMKVEDDSKILGKTDFDFFLSEHAKEAFESEKEIIRTGIPLLNQEEKETWSDGRITWVSTTKMPFFDEKGSVIGTFGISRDITQAKKLEMELLNAKNYFNHILEAVPVPIFVKDSNHKWVFLNESWCQFNQANKNDYLGKSDYDLHNKEEADLFWQRDELVFQTGEVTINEEIITNRLGITRTVLTKKTRFADEYGNNFIIGSMMDITDLKHTQNKLINYQDYLHSIINSLIDPVFVKNKKHQFILVNDAFCESTCLKREEVINKTDYDFFPTEEADVFRANDEKVFATKLINVNEETLTGADGVEKTIITKKTYFKNNFEEEFIVVAITDISDLKRVEKDLIRYQNYLNTTFNVVPDPFYVKDANFRYNLVNDEFCNLFGLRREDIINKTDFDLFPTEDATEYRSNDDLALHSNTTLVKEERAKDHYGVYRNFLTKKNSFKNELNESYLVGISSDITEQKKAEELLASKEKYYRSLIQNSSDISSVLDVQGKVLYQSPSFNLIMGYQNDFIVGKSAFDYVHTDDRQRALIALENVLKEPSVPLRLEYRFLKAEGTYVHVESICTNLLEDEAIKGIVINTRDISDRKKAEAEIRDKSYILNSILSNMPVCVFRTDSRGNYTESTGSLVRQMGMVDNQVVGLNIFEVYPSENGEIRRAFDEGFSRVSGYTVVNGKEWYLETFFFSDNCSDGGIIGFTIDATERKTSEEKLQEYALSLEKSNKELDQFAYVVSHDLKAPLRAISNLSQWIEEDLGTDIPSECKKNMELLRGRVARMQALINGILEYSRVSRIKVSYENIPVGALLKDLINILDIPLSHPVFELNEMPAINANRTQLEQIFSNLISNAIKYHDKPLGKICIEYKELAGFHQFAVKDDGPGIAKEYHEKIFVIFQTLQARDKVESTGVGLAIVKKIIEEQGGEIWVESQVNEGATFIFTIPKIPKT